MYFFCGIRSNIQWNWAIDSLFSRVAKCDRNWVFIFVSEQSNRIRCGCTSCKGSTEIFILPQNIDYFFVSDSTNIHCFYHFFYNVLSRHILSNWGNYVFSTRNHSQYFNFDLSYWKTPIIFHPNKSWDVWDWRINISFVRSYIQIEYFNCAFTNNVLSDSCLYQSINSIKEEIHYWKGTSWGRQFSRLITSNISEICEWRQAK